MTVIHGILHVIFYALVVIFDVTFILFMIFVVGRRQNVKHWYKQAQQPKKEKIYWW